MFSQNTWIGEIFANFTSFILFDKIQSCKKQEIVHLQKLILQWFSFLFFFFNFFIIKRHVSKKLKKLRNSLSCKMFYITQFTKLYIKSYYFSPLWKFLELKWLEKWRNKICEKLCLSCFWFCFKISWKVDQSFFSKYLDIHKVFITI